MKCLSQRCPSPHLCYIVQFHHLFWQISIQAKAADAFGINAVPVRMDTHKAFQCSLPDHYNILHTALFVAGCHQMCSPCNLRRNNRFVMFRDIGRAAIAVILCDLSQLVVHYNALPGFQSTPAAFIFHDVCHHYAIPLLPAAQGAALLLRQDHCNLIVVIALNKRQKDKPHRLCFFRLNYQLSILGMPIPHQVSHRVLTCHNTLIIRKNHPAALVARFPIRQKCLYIEVVLAIRVKRVNIFGFKVHTDGMCRVHGFQCCNLRHTIRKISSKPRNAGTDNQIHLLVFGILHHALESVPLAQRCAGFSLIAVNILQIPVFRFCNLLGVIEGLILDGRNLLFA